VQFLQVEGVTWTRYSEEVLAEADAQDQPVVLDFTADWCIPCQELDRITFTDKEVVSAMQDVRPVKVDLTEAGTPRTERLRTKYDVAGVPTLVFLDEDGKEVKAARTVGFVEPSAFLDRLRTVRLTGTATEAVEDEKRSSSQTATAR